MCILPPYNACKLIPLKKFKYFIAPTAKLVHIRLVNPLLLLLLLLLLLTFTWPKQWLNKK